MKVKVKMRPKFELTFYGVIVFHISLNATSTSPWREIRSLKKRCPGHGTKLLQIVKLDYSQIQS